MEKCLYCGKSIETPHTATAGKKNEPITCCCETCVKKAQRFYRYVDFTLPFFWLGVIASICLIVYTAFTTPNLMYVWGGLSLLGLTALLFPFATPETFSMLGIKKAAIITRILGAAIMIAGAILMFNA
ncbi:MAG: hypothetical protein Q8865_04950 [Bacillota bacterium]|nr:hypothetical protein [Bacillota bacterium]